MDDYFWEPKFTFKYITPTSDHKRNIYRAFRLSISKSFSYVYLPDQVKIALLVTDEEEAEEDV